MAAVALAVAVACTNPRQPDASAVLRAARRTLGDTIAVNAVRTVLSVAWGHGHDQDYGTTVLSARDGRVIIRQVFADGKRYEGGVNQAVWQLEGGVLQPPDTAAKATIRGHDLFFLVFAPTTRLRNLRISPPRVFANRPAIVLTGVDDSNLPVQLFFAAIDTAPLGAQFVDTRRPTSDGIQLTFEDWVTRPDGLRLFSRATLRQGADSFDLAFTSVRINTLPDAAFAPPGAAKQSADSTSRPASGLLSGLSAVEPHAIPSDVAVACDSAATDLRDAWRVDPRRQDGTFADSFQETARLGCRLTLAASSSMFGPSSEPMSVVERRFGGRGWGQDLRLAADGPDGSDIGLRRGDLLCLLMAHGSGDDDSDSTTAHVDTAKDIEVIVECARDAASNVDAGVPDSLWRIAAALGLDSLYAIDVRLQYPPYLVGDFDGDGVEDAAVLVTDRKTGKLGVAFLLRGTRRALIAGAGNPPVGGPDDLSGIDRWSRFSKDATYDLTIHDHPGVPLHGDALWVARPDSTSAFLVWNGSGFLWDARPRR